ncbi:MAG TPA: hypothetical protein VI875_04855 [Candidatus Norongarragalinales archaeon]|nr:hypothetical protein [Candidatus Norongarragalinales archaeon]
MGRKRGQQSYAESVIPIILIIILALFIAAKLGYIDLSSMPLVGGLFPQSYIRIAVIGSPSPQLNDFLRSEQYRLAGVSYAVPIRQEAVKPGVLKNFDLIIAQNSRVCDRDARKEITKAVESGKKLLLIGDACTAVTDDPTAAGWDVGIGLMGNIMPVQWGGNLFHERGQTIVNVQQGKFQIIDQEHPIFNGILNHGVFEDTYTNVYPKANSGVLAYVEEFGGRPTSAVTYAIIESKGMLASGKVMYFSFDPATANPTGQYHLLLNTLLYLKGAKG